MALSHWMTLSVCLKWRPVACKKKKPKRQDTTNVLFTPNSKDINPSLSHTDNKSWKLRPTALARLQHKAGKYTPTVAHWTQRKTMRVKNRRRFVEQPNTQNTKGHLFYRSDKGRKVYCGQMIAICLHVYSCVQLAVIWQKTSLQLSFYGGKFWKWPLF